MVENKEEEKRDAKWVFYIDSEATQKGTDKSNVIL